MSEYAAVNLDAKESDLRKLNTQEYVAAITGTDPATVKDGQQPAAKITNEEVESRQRLWWLMLIGALLLFIAEGVLSRRMRTAKVIN